jgi:hypothetical protein
MAKKLAFIGTAALLVGVVLGFGMTPAKAVTMTVGTENRGSGFTSGIVNGGQVASDGESTFFPFQPLPITPGVSIDSSDGIVLPTLTTPWTLSPSSTRWIPLTAQGTTPNAWVLPALMESGEAPNESIGIWTNPLPLPTADLGTLTILESDGVTVSDIITFANVSPPAGATTPTGGAIITFQSDSTVPLPAALPLFATGLGGLGLLGWRRKRKAQAVA